MCHVPVRVTLPGADGGAGAAARATTSGITDGRMPGASAAAAAPAAGNENGVGLDECTVASPGAACAATGTWSTLQPRALGAEAALLIVRGIDFMSPQTAPDPTGRRARALRVRLPAFVTKTCSESVTGLLAVRFTVQLVVDARTSGGSISSTVVPGASWMLTTVTVSVAHS